MIHYGPFNHAAEPSDPRQRDEQEAHSLRYGASAFMVLPLTSGRIAVLGHMRDLHAICDTLDEVKEAGASIPMNVWRRSSEARKEWAAKPVDPTILMGIDIDALDLTL